jgi:hypothetical protein
MCTKAIKKLLFFFGIDDNHLIIFLPLKRVEDLRKKRKIIFVYESESVSSQSRLQCPHDLFDAQSILVGLPKQGRISRRI